MIGKILTISAVLMLCGCITTRSCLETVAVTQLTVTEAARTVTALKKSDVVNDSDLLKAAEYITDAGRYVNNARPMCVLDEEKAETTLDTAKMLIEKATKLLEKK